MTDPTPSGTGDPAARLQAIKDRAGVVAKLGPPRPGGDLINAAHRSAADVPLLLKAVEEVLKLHRPDRVVIFGFLCKRHESHRHFSITRTEADDVRACQDCTATVYTSCTGCGPQVNVSTCPVREAIRGTLAGEAGNEPQVP